MYNPTVAMFKQTLAREGTEITNNGQVIPCFFRKRNDDLLPKETAYLYTAANAQIQMGDIFTYSGKQYLVMSKEQEENTEYKKYSVLQTNYNIKIMIPKASDSSKADLYQFPCFVDDINLLLHKSTVITIDSRATIITPDNEASRRIKGNMRFYACGTTMAFKITDLIYINGFCTIYAERNEISAMDDLENEIANRWSYESKDTYTVSASIANSVIFVGDTETVVTTVTKNGAAYTPASGELTLSVDNTNIIQLAESTVTALAAGTATITATIGGVSAYCAIEVQEVIQTAITNVQATNATLQDTVWKICEDDTAVFTLSKTQGGATISSAFTFVDQTGMTSASTYYTFTVLDSNRFSIYNKKRNLTKQLLIAYTDNNTQETGTIDALLIAW